MKKLFVLIGIICCLSISAFAASKNPVVVMKTTEGDIVIELFKNEAPITVENFIGLAEGTKTYTDTDGKKKKGHFYDGLIFHRVLKDFMIQGGDLTGTGTGNPGFRIPDEINGKMLGLDKMKAFSNGQPHQYLIIRSQKDFNMRLLEPLARKMGITNQQELEKRQKELLKELDMLTLLGAYENLGFNYNDKLTSTAPLRGAIAMANSGPDTGGAQFFINVVDTPWLTGKHTVFGKVIKGMDVADKISKAKVDPKGKPAVDIKVISIRLKK